jgi:signal transduction histidine kinase
MQQEPTERGPTSDHIQAAVDSVASQRGGTVPPGGQDLRDHPREMSHELRTSLAVITLLSGNLDLLYERLHEDKRRKIVRDIRKHAQRLYELVDDLLRLLNDRSN